MAKKSAPVLELEGSFGNVTVGEKTMKIGFTLERKKLSLSKADSTLCDKRLTGTLTARPIGWEPDQKGLDGMEEDAEVKGSFDIKGFRVSSDILHFGLTFMIKSVDISMLARFAKRDGTICVEDVDEIPVEERAPKSENGDGEEE
jgi:hypothetical protein